MAGTHAKLSPSSAKRWLNCTASVALAAEFPDPASEYAAEGTAAHELAAEVLEKGGKAAHRLGHTIEADGYTFEVTPEMAGHVQRYVDFIDARVGQARYVEQRVPLVYTSEGDARGTADVVAFDEAAKKALVIDLKYGKGVAVEAEDNPQLKLYALGVVSKFERFYDFDTVELHIFQPRKDSHTMWEVSVADLQAWLEAEVNPAAEAIEAGETSFRPGAWCSEQFCPARHECAARAEMIRDEALADFENLDLKDDGGRISNDRIAELLKLAPQVTSFFADLQTAAVRRLTEGDAIPGWKLVMGRSNRQWKDAVEAETALRARKIKVKEILNKKLKSPAQIEAVLGKQYKRTQDFMSKHAYKPPGKPTLAEVDDPRPEFAIRAEEEFENLSKQEDQ